MILNLKILKDQFLFEQAFHFKKINPVFILFILLSSSVEFKSQDFTAEKIDSISKVSWSEVKNNNFQKFNEIQKTLLEESRKLNYEKGIANAYYKLGISYKMLGKLDEAIKSFNDFKNTSYSKSKFSMLAETERSIGECYFQQNLFDNAIEKFRAAILIGENSGEKKFAINAINYNNIAASMQSNSGKKDSIYYYTSKSYYFIKNLSGKVTSSDEKSLASAVTVNLADIWDENNRPDSALYYYNKAIEVNAINNNVGANMLLKHRIGDFLMKNKKYKEAEKSYKESIELATKAKNVYCLRDNYKSIRKLYKEMEKEKEYLKYSELDVNLSDTLGTLEIKSNKAIINNIVKDKEDKFENSKSKLYWIIGSILFLGTLASIAAYVFHRNMKRRKQKIISEKMKTLTKKDEIIMLKQIETAELKLQVNESFEEVIQLAKENKAEFLMRFQEVYPAFYQKLINTEPKLLTTEIKLCAMIHLGFSSKDIAEYTFVTLKAAQHRKFRLRKKLDIPSDVDINVWLNS